MDNQNIDVKQAKLKAIVSQGSNTQASNIVTNVLSGIRQNLNTQITKQSLSTLQKQNVDVSPKDIQGLTNPVKVDNHKINKVKDHQDGGNTPFLMFMPVWMGSIITSVMLFFAFRTSNNIKLYYRIIASIGQMIAAVVSAFLGAFGFVYFMGLLGFDFNHSGRVTLFVAIAILGFVGLILGVMVWLGMKALPILILLMFFSMQMITLPKEMLPKGYQTWLYEIDLLIHYTTNLRQIIYLGQDIQLNYTMFMFFVFFIFGAVSSLLSALIRKHSTKRTEVPS